MDVDYPGFGAILIDGERFDHDVVVESEGVRRRKKGPSKPYGNRYGHTPLSPNEEVPWSAPLLVVGTGASGRLPLMPEVWEEAKAQGVELIALPTSEAASCSGRSMSVRSTPFSTSPASRSQPKVWR